MGKIQTYAMHSGNSEDGLDLKNNRPAIMKTGNLIAHVTGC